MLPQNAQFINPTGVAIDGLGNIYVVDSMNTCIQKFDSNGNYLGEWGSYGSGNGQFKWPYGVAVDGQGNVYVADTGNNRIQKFDSSGNYLGQWGSYGSGNGQFNWPLAWRWTPRGMSMSPISVIIVSRNSTPAEATSANGAVSAPETGSSIIPMAWRWTPRGTSMWPIR